MTRDRIGGFEVRLFGMTVEVVTVDRLPVCIAAWKGDKLLGRIEK